MEERINGDHQTRYTELNVRHCITYLGIQLEYWTKETIPGLLFYLGIEPHKHALFSFSFFCTYLAFLALQVLQVVLAVFRAVCNLEAQHRRMHDASLE